MPELPDVENFKRYFEATALQQRIERVAVLNVTVLRGLSASSLSRALTGRKFTGTRRYGKHLFVALDKGPWVMFHFGMTGSLLYFEDLADDPKHDRLRFDFANGHHLAFVNQRLFGRVGLVEDPAAFIADEDLGPDALDKTLDEEAFRQRLAGRRGKVKAALMDQSLLAGIGNIYSDEILFQARIHPQTPLGALDDGTLTTLYRTMRRVLEVAVDSGAGSETLDERLPADYLLPQRKEGGLCPRCAAAIQSLKAGGRTAYYCRTCQPSPGSR